MSTESQRRSPVHEADDSLVAIDRFFLATRDSGYKGTSSAIAELVDNALQAGATQIVINVESDEAREDGSLRLEVIDNGSGMDEATLHQALRFGGSTRFNDRRGLGRYGMGLPNSSLSQARRVDVYTWQSPRSIITSFLDLDEVIAGRLTRVPKPTEASPSPSIPRLGFRSGTAVVWDRCDRLDHRRVSTITKKLHGFLGRVFRYFLWEGVKIVVNGETVKPIDPLFLNGQSVATGGRAFGAPLEYDIKIPLPDGRGVAEGRVVVLFSELPVDKWHHLSNDEKQKLGIPKSAGVSVVRAKREIEFGWFFMGDKRKENYDDWWRCEVRFDPGLDEVFGITHTKQQVRPTHDLLEILTPDLEATAKTLHRRVRLAHEELKVCKQTSDSELVAAAKDRFLPPLPPTKPSDTTRRSIEALERRHPRLKASKLTASQPSYSIVESEIGGKRVFSSYRRGGQLIMALNTDHPFYKRLYRPLSEDESAAATALRQRLDLVLLAAARAEVQVGSSASRQFLDAWSSAIATFLS